MPSKNSIGALKNGDSGSILPSRQEERLTAPETVETISNSSPSKRAGRPRLKEEERRDYKITLSLTQAQGKRIKELAGLANEATYVYAFLKKQGVID